MQVRPFRLVGDNRRAQLRTLVQAVVAEWAAAWGVGAPDLEVKVDEPASTAAAVPGDQPWRQHWAGGQGGAWCDWSATSLGEVAALVFPADGNYAPMPGAGPLAAAGAEAAFDGLLDALRARCVGAQGEVSLLRAPHPDSLRTGSGAVRITIALRRAALRLLLDGDCVGALLPRAQPRPLPGLEAVALREALRTTPVSLGVTAGEVEIGAGTLLGLGVGDVIALPVALDHGFSVALAGGARLCSGYIGRCGDRLAVEIVK